QTPRPPSAPGAGVTTGRQIPPRVIAQGSVDEAARQHKNGTGRGMRLLRDLGSGSGPARLGLGAWRDAPTLRLPAVVGGVAHSWPATRRAPCEGSLERGLPSSK